MYHTCFISVLLSFAVSVLLGPTVISVLKRVKCRQTVREDGPRSHLKKSGTPTMGGIIILSGVALSSVMYIGKYDESIQVLFLMFGFGMVGFLDDYIKVILSRSEGLTPIQKLAGQLAVSLCFAYYMTEYSQTDMAMRIPFSGGRMMDFGSLNIPVFLFIVLGTANGTNFTDGLDGLAGSVTLIISVFFAVTAIGLGSGAAPAACAVAGALMGFLLFNVYPASVFMGDTGSLALGGFVAACAYMLHLQLYIALVGVIYMAEVISVILQVAWFKISGGKRLFRMAPLHHHLELCGIKETRIVAIFTILTAVMCLVGLRAL
ncbi:MAG: phospho-N-acetylmuramoyl-pentapeptide-transferase [Lachnospiraceae bacterium]|nr:phospho-N-acetylmuramoyl-pentapeptide-transferase [Lachnospiraceae bacterium]